MWQLITEDQLETRQCDINSHWDSQVEKGSFSGIDDIDIHYAISEPQNARTAVVFSNGRIETVIKYKAFLYECYINNIAVYALDHRGQGLSGRVTDDPQRGYVVRFNDYLDDLSHFVKAIVLPRLDTKPVLACHSMGSAIGYLTALREPELFQKVLFCSPMFGVRPSIPAPLLQCLLAGGLTANQWFGRKPWYAFGQSPYIDIPFKLNTLTHSKTRYKAFREAYKLNPTLQLGGVTYAWLKQATTAMNTIEATSQEFPLPAKVLVSGADMVVDNRRILKVANALPNAEIQIIDGAKHELLFESDEFRTPAMNAFFDFVTKS